MSFPATTTTATSATLESTLKYLSVGSKEFDEVCALISQSHPDECVICVYSIQNPAFEERFEKFREILTNKRSNPPTQLRAFHGCSLESAQNIASKGFQRSFNRVSAYGVGTYFSGFYNVSRQYSVSKRTQPDAYHALIVADVLLGKLGRQSASGQIDTEKMDASVDHPTKPKVIALPYDDAALPRYLVQFHRETEIPRVAPQVYGRKKTKTTSFSTSSNSSSSSASPI